MADEMSPGLAAEMEARTVGGAGAGSGAEDGALVTKLRLAKTDCRIALQSVSRAQRELAGIVEGWVVRRDPGDVGDAADAEDWLEYLGTVEAELARLVQWARGCEDQVLVRMNGRGKDV